MLAFVKGRGTYANRSNSQRQTYPQRYKRNSHTYHTRRRTPPIALSPPGPHAPGRTSPHARSIGPTTHVCAARTQSSTAQGRTSQTAQYIMGREWDIPPSCYPCAHAYGTWHTDATACPTWDTCSAGPGVITHFPTANSFQSAQAFGNSRSPRRNVPCMPVQRGEQRCR